MKKIKFLLTGITILAVTATFAQKSESKKSDEPKVSIGVEAALPVGNLSKSTSFGIGGSVDIAIPIFDGGAVTFNPGYIAFTGKTINGVKLDGGHLIPIKAGLRFKIGESGLYGEPQLGYTKYSGEGSGGAFTYAAKIGYMMSALDVSARYEASSKSEEFAGIKETFTTSFIGLRIAYSFGL